MKHLLYASITEDSFPDPIKVDYSFNIARSKRSLDISVTSLSKKLRLTYDKRKIISNETMETLPFGFDET